MNKTICNRKGFKMELTEQQKKRYQYLLINKDVKKTGESWEEFLIKSYERSDETRDSSPSWPEQESRRKNIELARELDKLEKESAAAPAEIVVAEKPKTLAEKVQEPGLTGDKLDAVQRWAKLFLTADVIPAEWLKTDQKTALARVVVCLQLAESKKINPLLLLQNVDFIAGKLCWKSTFILQLLRAAGWRSYEFRFAGDPRSDDFWQNEKNGCQFLAKNPESGKIEEGTFISVGMVKKEGWKDRKGSKWQSMPEQMFKYRAAAFFCRSNAPEVLAGFYSQDEMADIVAAGG